MNAYIFPVLNGLGLGMIYFLMAVGLSILFGLLNFVNFAHGAFFLVGAYVCYQVAALTDSFLVSLLVAPFAVALLGWALNRFLLNRVISMSHSAHILITFGIMLVLQELVISAWGPLPRNVRTPEFLQGVLMFGDFVYPRYRLFVLLTSAIVAIVLYMLIVRTKFGALLRAASEEAETVSLLGANVRMLYSVAFALGGWLAGLAGAMAAPLRGVDPAMGMDALAIAFAVVIVGGLGSFSGALVGGLFIGLVQSVMSMLWPEGARLMIYASVAVLLILRPNGLFGRT
ncbi:MULTISPECIES: branched-chain amino acid ABC transporter permease [unclassified Variovorax]|uniref:branched-chain amino acid ABC transporter permease n=1 Tax=unclassified Variovorax TaxID=663243 RepID=UPI00076CF489|nr:MULTISPECIES: branched-chain amino acid ABC transporter permease [unclassified Variovorax]KWT97953.1 High-affinity branched-chain amino acid transport system permease protein LivH [Variovorax sp. WDL1]PNG59208.1 High-affinity branched-chain amino acid transport system permease protein LivH [Variovorax sp. B4]PNG61001.1 High-affinity branched-chain amino acid transport system permease protein LivH [Variovorax sp. B2]VTV13061.1 LIV-I protein H [Variovorax sp. WDL1]